MDEETFVDVTPGETEQESSPTSLDIQPPASPESPARRREWVAFLKETLFTFLLGLLFYFVINLLTVRTTVWGYSMMPTFRGGEYLLVWRWAYWNRLPERGDIVVYRDEEAQAEYVKRVIGLPGEEVLIQNGRVFINGEPLTEPYVQERPRYEGYWKVPEGHVFLLGDNRNHSTDSHITGPVPLKNIIGKVVLIYWPPEAIRVFR